MKIAKNNKVINYMDSLNVNIYSIEEIKNKLIEYSEQYPVILGEFKKYYIFYNKNPDYNEYKINYDSQKDLLQQINNNISNIQTNLEKRIYENNHNNQIIDEKIKNEKQINEELNSLLSEISGLDDPVNKSDTLLENAKTQYKNQFISNIGFFLGIVIVFITISKI
jgi:hypothetical protein